MKRILTIFIFLYLVSILSYGQRMPDFIHYVTNPYLYNPAFAGNEKSAVLFATHRQQWLGVDGAPVSSNLSFHTPAGHANPVSLGADITNDRIGILNNTAFRTTFAYLVPLGVEREHFFRLGLSAGLGTQQFNLTDIDISDDFVLQNTLKNSMYWDGRFGIQYHVENLNLGFTLPHIFSNPLVNPDGLSAVEIDVFSRFLISANYKINLSATESFAFEPTVLYNVSQETGNQLEAYGIFHIKEALWVGGGYQQQAGIAGLLGFKVKNIKFGYAYGMGGNGIAQVSSGTHEVQLGFILGKKQEIMKRKPRLSTSTNSDRVREAAILESIDQKKEPKKKKEAPVSDRKKAATQPLEEKTETTSSSTENKDTTAIPSPEEIIKENNESLTPDKTKKETDYSQLRFESLEPGKENQLGAEKDKENPVNQKQVPPQPQPEEKKPVSETEKPDKKASHPLEIKGGKYIIAGSFSQEDNARKLISKLSAEGYEADLGYQSEKNFYYVYLLRSGDLDMLTKELQQLKQVPLFKNAWILSVDE